MTRKFIVLDGQAVSFVGECSDGQALPAGNVIFDIEPPGPGPWRYVEGQFIKVDVAPPDYRERRREAYPPLAEFIDAQVKIASGNGPLIAEGRQQMADYVSACLAVKARFPKEV